MGKKRKGKLGDSTRSADSGFWATAKRFAEAIGVWRTILGAGIALLTFFGFTRGSNTPIQQQTAGSGSPIVNGNNNVVNIVSGAQGIIDTAKLVQQAQPQPETDVDSFPYLTPNINQRTTGDEVHFTLELRSQKNKMVPSPLSFITGEITDTAAYSDFVVERHGDPGGDASWHTKRWVQGRNLIPGGMRVDSKQYFEDTNTIETLKIPPGIKNREYRFEYTSDAGKMTQELRLKKAGIRWLTNSKVWLHLPNQRDKILQDSKEF